MPRVLLYIVLTVAVPLGLAACGSSKGEEGGSVAGPPLQTITVTETEFSLDPSTITLSKPGIYAFRAVNSGQVTHGLEIEGDGVEAKTQEIGPGGEAVLKVKLSKAGTYNLYCPVGNHKDQGMTASVSVGGAATSGGY